jgi:outer membrane biosynthesis protein TonB
MFRFIHISVLIILVVGLITQVICPIFGVFSDRMFWIFRKKEKKIAETLKDIDELKVTEELIGVIKEKQEKLKGIQESLKPNEEPKPEEVTVEKVNPEESKEEQEPKPEEEKRTKRKTKSKKSEEVKPEEVKDKVSN